MSTRGVWVLAFVASLVAAAVAACSPTGSAPLAVPCVLLATFAGLRAWPIRDLLGEDIDSDGCD